MFLQTFIRYKRTILEHGMKIANLGLFESSKQIAMLHSNLFEESEKENPDPEIRLNRKNSKFFSESEMHELISTTNGIKDLQNYVNTSIRSKTEMIWLLKQLDELYVDIFTPNDSIIENYIQICQKLSDLEKTAIILNDIETTPGLSILIELYHRCPNPNGSDLKKVLCESLTAREDVEQTNDRIQFRRK
jgi:hypothetical protein